MQNRNKSRLVFSLTALTTLFFMWGFITCMNDILIPFLKKVFDLNYAQAMLVQFSFFGAYFVGSFLYFIISITAGDPIQRIGYKKGIIGGLIVSAVACFMFYPAAQIKVYGVFLAALFILGLGFTLLQIAANPYVAILGRPETSSSRLNLSQAMNSFGTTIAPIIGGYLVFHFFTNTNHPLTNAAGNPVLTDTGASLSANGVIIPYLVFSGIFFLMAVFFALIRLPDMTSAAKPGRGAGALRYRQLVLGMIAIFLYVGGEVSVGSVLINYMKELMGYPEMEAKWFLAFYWGGAMIGRFLGAISLSGIRNNTRKYLIMFVAALLASGVIYAAVFIEGGLDFRRILPFFILLALNFGAFMIGKSLPHRTLSVFAVVVIGLLITTIFGSGEVAKWAVIGIGLFNSIMWSNIFTLAISGLGKHTSQGSSLLVMAILGGAILPYIQGSLADITGIQLSFVIPVISYIYIAFYGINGYKPSKKTPIPES